MPPKSAAGGIASTPTPTAGIINVNPTAIQPAQAKSARLKVIVRRLPPGLTRKEFEDALGDKWRVGAGKVDWIEYRCGKVRSPGKYPEQSRAYIHFINDTHIKPFEETFLATIFHDAKGTHRHPDLKYLPPTLEFAPLQRVPNTKTRLDSRQGLIDQDPEYMAFLEGETLAVPKAPAVDSNPTERTREVVTSTPLIEALREKKAAKAKAAAAKAAKQRPKVEEQASTEKSKLTKGRKAKEDVKAATKDAKHKDNVKTASKDGKVAPDPSVSSANGATASPARKRERPPASIKSMLQRDLGLTPPTRGAARDIAKGAASTTSEKKGQAPPTEPAAARNARSKRDGVAAAKLAGTEAAKSSEPPRAAARTPKANTVNAAQMPVSTSSSATTSKPLPANATPAARTSRPAPKPSPGATKTYLKHANASQGVTEDLLRIALTTFGELVSLDLDKRKGTALAEFKTPEGLSAAMAKRLVPVGQGAVEVLEYKDKAPGTPARGANGGRGANRGPRARGGGRAASSNTPAATTAAPNANPPD